MVQNSCLERSSPISHRALQYTLGLSIDVCNSCFSANFAKDADEAVWRFVAFWQFRNFKSKYPVSSCHPNTLHVGPSTHSAESCSCCHHTIAQNMEKHLSISVEHFEKRRKFITDQESGLGFTSFKCFRNFPVGKHVAFEKIIQAKTQM